jgi:hypothetical protein
MIGHEIEASPGRNARRSERQIPSLFRSEKSIGKEKRHEFLFDEHGSIESLPTGMLGG